MHFDLCETKKKRDEMAVAGLYRRILPSPPAIEFASSSGKNLFSEALQSGTMEGFFRLVSYLQTQSEPAYCGLASLCVVLNALSIDPRRKWKGPWRWFDESMLDCCEPLDKVKSEGITFGKVACLAHCAGAKVEPYRSSHSTVEEFREHVIRCSSSDDSHLIASYHRSPLKQTGSGHFSPIGGYHAKKDMVLILDVARFKYPPHWVPLPLLWDAINTVDEATGLPRGFILISRLPRPPSLLYTLSCKHENWVEMLQYLKEDVPKLVASEPVRSVHAILSKLLTSLPASAGDFIKWVVEVRRKEEGSSSSSLNFEEIQRLNLKEEILRQIRETELFKIIKELLSASVNINSSINDKFVASVCCQGAAILTGNRDVNQSSCCEETCVRVQSSTIVSGTVIGTGGIKQGVDLLVPDFPKPNCVDNLTVLILALTPKTWLGIKDENLFDEMQRLVSIESLPELLQWEILHIRKQLLLLRIDEKELIGNSLSLP